VYVEKEEESNSIRPAYDNGHFASFHFLNLYPANVDFWASSNNASKWEIGFNSVAQRLMSLRNRFTSFSPWLYGCFIADWFVSEVTTEVSTLFCSTRPNKCAHNVRNSTVFDHDNMFRHYCLIFRNFSHQVLNTACFKTWCKNFVKMTK